MNPKLVHPDVQVCIGTMTINDLDFAHNIAEMAGTFLCSHHMHETTDKNESEIMEQYPNFGFEEENM